MNKWRRTRMTVTFGGRKAGEQEFNKGDQVLLARDERH